MTLCYTEWHFKPTMSFLRPSHQASTAIITTPTVCPNRLNTLSVSQPDDNCPRLSVLEQRVPVLDSMSASEHTYWHERVRWLSGEGVGLVIRRLPDRFPAVPNDIVSLGKAHHPTCLGRNYTYCKSLWIRASTKCKCKSRRLKSQTCMSKASVKWVQ